MILNTHRAGQCRAKPLLRLGAVLLALLTGATTAHAQKRMLDAERQLQHDFDSLVKWQRKNFPDAGLVRQIANAYDTLNKPPRRLLAELDSVGIKAGIDMAASVNNMAAVYTSRGMFDSLQFNRELQEVLPAVDAYQNYLCGCGAVEYKAPHETYGKRLRKRLDSCAAAIREWDGWSSYKKLVDSVGADKVASFTTDAYAARMMQNCHAYRVAVSSGLPQYIDFSPHAQYIVRFNAFHRRMSEAVVRLDEKLALEYVSPAEVKKLKTHFGTVKNSFAGQRRDLRMAFYNDMGKFYFLVDGRVASMLSYDYFYEDDRFRLRNVAYRLRAELADTDKDDAMILNHLFRYPLIALRKYGLPLNADMPESRIERNSYHEDINGMNLTPPVE